MVYPQAFGGMVNRVRGLFGSGSSLLERVSPDLELPWLNEQIRTHAAAVRLRHSVHTDNFTGETVEMRLAYRRALAEPPVKAALLGKIANVASLTLNVRPAGKTDLDTEIADCIKHCLTKCSGGTYQLIWAILSGGLVDGWSLSEKKLKVEERGRFRGKWVLDRLKSKDTRQIEPEVDQFRNVTGFYSFRANAGHWFPPDRFVHFSYLSFFENPTGQSDLRAIYRAIEMIPAALKLRMMFLDKFSGPWIKGRVKDKALKKSMGEALKNARARGYIVLEEGSEVEVVDMAVRGTADFQQAIEDLRQEIAVGISGAFLHMLTGMNPGARGDSEVQKDTVVLFVWLLATMVAQVINEQIIPQFVDWNYGQGVEYPTAHLEAVNPQDVVADLQIDKALKELGFKPNKKYILEKTGRPAYDPADPTDDDKEPKTQPGVGSFPFGGGPGSIPAIPFAEGLAADQWFIAFAESTGFTGSRKDSLGRTICFQSGKRIACPDDPSISPKAAKVPTETTPEAKTLAKSVLGRAVGATPGMVALWEISHLSRHLRHLSHEDLTDAMTALKLGSKHDPAKVAEAKKAIVEKLKLERREFWQKRVSKKDPTKPKDTQPTPTEPPTPEPPKTKSKLDYRHRDPAHPVAVALRNDTATADLIAEFLDHFGKDHELASQEESLSKQWLDSLDESNAIYKRLTEARKKGGYDSKEATKLRDEYLANTEKSHKLQKLRDRAREVKDRLSREGREWVLKRFAPDNPSRFHWTPIDKPDVLPGAGSVPPLVVAEPLELEGSEKRTDVINDGFSFLGNLVGGSLEGRVHLCGSPDGRAFYNHFTRDKDGNPRLAISNGWLKHVDKGSPSAVEAVTSEVVHELGHHIEYTKPGLQQKANEFLNYRLGGEKPQKLKDLFPTGGYADWEEGAKDTFDRAFGEGHRAYYVGKRYDRRSGNATEIISMGLELLWQNPVAFAKADPEYFQWLVSNIRG